MKTQLLITVEHPDEQPASMFIDIVIKSVLNDINADCDEGWSVSYGRPIELVCCFCDTPVETAEELTETKWTGKLCPDCMEQQVWK
jgi:hypothetical protein